MKHSTLYRFLSAAACSLSLLATGCAAFQSRGVHEEFRGKLDAERTVVLSRSVQRDMLRTGERHNYAELELALENQEGVLLHQQVARIAGTYQNPPAFRFGTIEGRVSEQGDKLWFIDQEARKIIASIDLETQRVTGPADAAPEWAGLRNGKTIEPSR